MRVKSFFVGQCREIEFSHGDTQSPVEPVFPLCQTVSQGEKCVQSRWNPDDKQLLFLYFQVQAKEDQEGLEVFFI